MGGMAGMDEYRKAPDTAWRDIDRQAIEDQYGGTDIHGIKLPPVSADEPRAWRDAIIGETPADALVNWGLGGTGKAAKAALALGGLFKMADPAEAANPLKVLRSTSVFKPASRGRKNSSIALPRTNSIGRSRIFRSSTAARRRQCRRWSTHLRSRASS